MAVNILAVDATGEILSVALEKGGKVYALRRSGKKPHDETLLPAVESALKRAKLSWDDLDAVAAAAGPGRFTGIRIGLSFASILGMKLKIPALALSRLEAAAEKSGAGDVLAALPGWKNEVYSQRFQRKKSGLAAFDQAEWTSPEAWPARRAASQAQGVAVAEGERAPRAQVTVAVPEHVPCEELEP